MKKIVRIGAIALIAFAAIGVMSCDFVSFLITSVSGSAVNAMAEGTQVEFYKGEGTATLVGAKITLTNQSSDGADASGTVASDGTFTLYDVEPGRYILSGEHTGWTFVPRLVDITGFMTTLPTVIAYPTANASDIFVLVEWENTDYDIDAYMVRDNIDNDIFDGSIIVGYDNDDVIQDNLYYRDSQNKIFLERDVTTATPDDIPRVETIRVTAPLNTAYEDLRYYLRVFTSTGSLTGDNDSAPAGATVFVMQGNTHLGTFPIAYNTYEDVLGVVAMRWNTGTQAWDIGSFGGAWLNGDGDGIGGIKSISFSPVVVDEIR